MPRQDSGIRVDHLARLARLALTPAERLLLEHQLGQVLTAFESLQALDTEGITETTYVRESVCAGRPDGPLEAAELPRGSSLVRDHAPRREADLFSVPKVL